MTDNEQYEALYNTAVSRVQALFAGAPTPGEVVRELERAGWRPMTPQELAAHRVTLVADSREALEKTISENLELVPELSRPHRARRLVDALLASGVVQVTTPTEADDTLSVAIARLTRLREYVERKNGSIFTAEYRRERDWGTAELDRLKEAVGLGFIPDTRDALLIMQAYAALASRPAPVAPPTEEWEDPEPYIRNDQRFSRERARVMTVLLDHLPRTREEYEADQTPVVPVDALGFPTQEGATFTAAVALGERRTLRFRVVGPGRFRAEGEGGSWGRVDLDIASIEDVRPADGRNGQ